MIRFLALLLIISPLVYGETTQNFSSKPSTTAIKESKPKPPERARPEVIIPNATKKQLLDIITNRMLDKGYQLASVNDYLAVFKKKADSFFAGIFFGSRYDSTPEARISFNFVEAPAGIRVIATLEMITNPGSGYERSTNCDKSKPANNVQKMLEEVKDSLDK
jgi:hypothetical protein